MNDRTVVAVLGHRNSGKSLTWTTLFGQTVRTGNRLRRLRLAAHEFIDVFLVSGSPEERETYVGEIVGEQNPRIVLCSMQYREDVTDTIDYFIANGYGIYSHWLNPGCSDQAARRDDLGIVTYLLDRGAVVAIRDGRVSPATRVQELADFLYGWAKSRGLLRTV